MEAPTDDDLTTLTGDDVAPVGQGPRHGDDDPGAGATSEIPGQE